MQPYEIVEHTADIGIRATGRSLEELFAHMAQGMFSLIVPPESVEERQSVPVKAEGGPEQDRLLQAWLRELLYLFDTRHFLGKRFSIEALRPGRIEATVFGETLDPARHPVDKEVKAVTYCELGVEQLPDGTWRAQVIFDI